MREENALICNFIFQTRPLCLFYLSIKNKTHHSINQSINQTTFKIYHHAVFLLSPPIHIPWSSPVIHSLPLHPSIHPSIQSLGKSSPNSFLFSPSLPNMPPLTEAHSDRRFVPENEHLTLLLEIHVLVDELRVEGPVQFCENEAQFDEGETVEEGGDGVSCRLEILRVDEWSKKRRCI